jgi:hypothetical protein
MNRARRVKSAIALLQSTGHTVTPPAIPAGEQAKPNPALMPAVAPYAPVTSVLAPTRHVKTRRVRGK